MPDKVSVVIISFNALEDLRKCLDSLRAQDFESMEAIVVDDASSDGTVGFLKDYTSETWPAMIVVRNEKNLGVAGARNAGIRRASGEIIAFTDADCVADPRWVSELVRSFETREAAAVGGKVFEKRVSNIWELTDKGHDYVAPAEGYVSNVVGCNMAFRADILGAYMFNDEIKYGYEEAYICDQLRADGHKIYFNPRAVVFHKRRSSLRALLRRKYLLGLSSIWYRKKQGRLFMFKRHIVFLAALLCLPLSLLDDLFMYLSLFLALLFCFSLLRDELAYKEKNLREIALVFPFLIFIELAHFAGSVAGLIKFRLLKASS